MTRISLSVAAVGGAAFGGTLYAASAKAPAKDPPPIANYWMDVATASGMGGGMAPGGRPDMGQIMQMMQGGGASVAHTLDLRLASRTRPAGAGEADHFIPAVLQMGPSLPLITPVREPPATSGMPWQQPKGRMLIYWGCGEHVSAGQPTVVDFSKLAAGQAPPGVAAMAAMAHAVSGPSGAPGFGRWPNDRDHRAVPAGGSLLGAHSVKGNYSPEIGFSLGNGQDFMPGLGLREAGPLPSGASQLTWQPAAMATGYALAMFGANPNNDFVMWSSSKSATMPALDYLAPSEVRRLVAAGSVLSPGTSQCVLPAEVAAAVPAGMVTMIGYGPEANFAEMPKAPKWVAKVRYKTTASVMHGMGGMMDGMGAAEADQQQQDAQQPPVKKKKRGLGLGDLIGAVPH
ncbi:hypothetical protein [Sphingomonas sp. URHD0057]|uniref:hypothetical protein n=1 Tax=Sphingomonas sp. URHD0057 TaxID=1380389 RepID=UPI0006882808|nr:hypothetical protein [Sphingomonas sp. URHD0057]